MVVKERYFTPASLEQVALEMMQTLGARRRAMPFRPERSALLILDMQAYFLDAASHAYVPSAEAILPSLQELARVFATRGRPVIYTQHLNTAQDAGMMARWWTDLITADHPSGAIVPAFDVSAGVVLQKTQYDAFYGTALEGILRQRAVTQVVTCGVMTHLCCETTARSAFVRGFEVFFPIDGTATYNRHFHLSSLRNLAHGFAAPVLMRDVLDAVRGAGED
jgi:isochorismate hydrolase